MRRQLIALGMLCGLLPGFVVHTHAAEAPAVSAASAVLMDAETGRVLYAHNEQEPRAIASTTKLMTALVAAEYLGGDLSETVEIKREWTGIEGTSLYLKPGETITLKPCSTGCSSTRATTQRWPWQESAGERWRPLWGGGTSGPRTWA